MPVKRSKNHVHEKGFVLSSGLKEIDAHRSLTEIMQNKGLAALGDTYVNFVYSLALSEKNAEPTGVRVKGQILAEALKKAELRKHLPSRVNRHTQGDAAEALIVYAWLHEIVSLEECVKIIEKNIETPTEAFTILLEEIERRLDVIK